MPCRWAVLVGYLTHHPQRKVVVVKKLFAILPLVVALSFVFIPSPAFAVDGAMNANEYNWIDTGGAGQNTRAEVQAHCDCTGVRVWTGFRFDNDAIGMRYSTPSGADAYVYFVIRDGARWAYAKDWCNDSGCQQGDV